MKNCYNKNGLNTIRSLSGNTSIEKDKKEEQLKKLKMLMLL